MKLIIDIPEYMYIHADILLVKDFPVLKKIIANGTPLPKGHGRLVDENYIIPELVYHRHLLANGVKCSEITKIFDSAVIIDVDKEES